LSLFAFLPLSFVFLVFSFSSKVLGRYHEGGDTNGGPPNLTQRQKAMMLLNRESLRQEKMLLNRESKERKKEKPEPSNNLYKLGQV